MPLAKSELQANLRKLRKSLKRAPKRLTPEEVHKLRTRARRLLSLADSDSLAPLAQANLGKVLKRVRKRAGRVRDMDVHTLHLADMHSASDPSCRTQLLEYLGAKRYRRADRLTRLLEDHGPALRKELRRVGKRIAKDTGRNTGKKARKARRKQSAQVLELTAGLSDPAHLTRANLHPYRLKVKELRDALRMAGGTGDSRFAGALGQCKDAIGEWHDWEELIAIGEKILGHGPQCPLLQELKEINKRKLDAALTVAERLRTDYARPGLSKVETGRTRGKSGEAPQPLPIPERALKAVAGALA
jgi:CHAD domain-containing protein